MTAKTIFARQHDSALTGAAQECVFRKARLRKLAPCLGLAMALVATPASSQSSAPEAATASPNANSDIVVTGRTEKAVQDFVRKLANADPDRQIARWNGPICLKIVGFAPKFAGIIRQRFTATAEALKIQMLQDRCTANVVIKLTDSADAITQAYVVRDSRNFGNRDDRILLKEGYKAALLQPRTVRWFGMTSTINADGTEMQYDADGHHIIHSASLIATPVKETMLSAIALIDEKRLANVTMRQLADYLTLVTLSRPDITADYAHTDSIMSLFATNGDGARPAGMTTQDRIFLEALYKGSGARTVKQQRAAIQRDIRKGILLIDEVRDQ